ncbi:hypothetical protein [Rhizobium sp. X9]|uniref:hypothetical protein n=1 Tax=Rhizobium sp. X9 TaxID=2815360 RepID=UPI001C0BA65E|nr:hypothetical protein [Rhizobium sp. X9]
MLTAGDLARFRRLYSEAERSPVEPADPAEILTQSKDIFAAEVWQLAKALQIAVVLGDAWMEEVQALSSIHSRLRGESCAGFDNGTAWLSAITWAIKEQKAADHVRLGLTVRAEQVGEACKRLRARGYQVEIQSYGVHLPDATQNAITEVVAGFVAALGGLNLAMQLCRVVSSGNQIHDGMWLFGNQIPGLYERAQPALPVGWLFSLALRFIGRDAAPRKPEMVWKNLVELSTDFAAAINCQRYSQYEEMHVQPTDVLVIFRDSVLWREVFSLPQAPTQLLSGLEAALKKALTVAELQALDFDLSRSFVEFRTLLKAAKDDSLTVYEHDQISRGFPNLWRIGKPPVAGVNREYLNPLAGGRRDYNRSIFLTHNKDRCVTLPRSMMREAFCSIIISRIRECLPERAADIVGDVMETAIEEGCKKASLVWRGAEYKADKQALEIDVGVREGNRFVLFETKSKSLTVAARSGSWFSFYQDYSQSYLTMVKQLARNDRNLRAGHTPLLASGETKALERSLKVAVSPLSYGPTSDKFLSNGVLRALAGVVMSPLSGSASETKVTDKFNKEMRLIERFARECAPKTDDGNPDLFSYLSDFHWLDVGEALYALDRSHNVVDFLAPLQSISFSTRDFWTEVAFADQQLITKKYWRPVGG